jgi:hypothetical protein
MTVIAILQVIAIYITYFTYNKENHDMQGHRLYKLFTLQKFFFKLNLLKIIKVINMNSKLLSFATLVCVIAASNALATKSATDTTEAAYVATKEKLIELKNQLKDHIKLNSKEFKILLLEAHANLSNEVDKLVGNFKDAKDLTLEEIKVTRDSLKHEIEEYKDKAQEGKKQTTEAIVTKLEQLEKKIEEYKNTQK